MSRPALSPPPADIAQQSNMTQKQDWKWCCKQFPAAFVAMTTVSAMAEADTVIIITKSLSSSTSSIGWSNDGDG